MPIEQRLTWEHVNKAFSKQSGHFDEDDLSNPVLQLWRKRIYAHVDQFIKPDSKILELNAGTGIDAIRFARKGHSIHAIDISDGMIFKIKEKTTAVSLSNKITTQQISFEELNHVNGKFDYVFSNFGGLNCSDDLKKVTRHLPGLLNKNSYVTWVIMPKVTPWEWLWMFRGEFKNAFRRFERNGVTAHLEGEFFKTYYYALNEIEESFGSQFRLVNAESLGVFSPPPSAQNFEKRFSGVSRLLNTTDQSLGKIWPFSRWGDHIIVTFQFVSE